VHCRGLTEPSVRVLNAPLPSSAGNELPILMQNENGPCPLLALANVLLLRGGIEIHPDYPEVTFEVSPACTRTRTHTHTNRHNVLGASTGPLGEAGRAHA